MSDADLMDILKCRWSDASNTTINAYDECAGLCSATPGAVLIQENCTLIFTLTIAGRYAGVALQIEDFYDGATTTPMSSVPLQFLLYGYAVPSNCTTPPAIIGRRTNGGNAFISLELA